MFPAVSQAKRPAEAAATGSGPDKAQRTQSALARKGELFSRVFDREASSAKIDQEKLLTAISKLVLTMAAQMRAFKSILLSAYLAEDQTTIVTMMKSQTEAWSEAIESRRQARVPKRVQELEVGLPHVWAWQGFMLAIEQEAKEAEDAAVLESIQKYQAHVAKGLESNKATNRKVACYSIAFEVRYARVCKTHSGKIKHVEFNLRQQSTAEKFFLEVGEPAMFKYWDVVELPAVAPPGEAERLIQQFLEEADQ